ncbi:MAG: hypothetical protein KC731_37090 [Myxococcales bacterium]|nr:hypothetical protein [Myxococcales bacterium]
MRVDTTGALERAQYDANRRFAEDYLPSCGEPSVGDGVVRPRVLVTGFGRFKQNRDNATGRIVSALLPALRYPETDPPAAGAIDPPGPQLAVARGVLTLPRMGEVEICAMVLPVFWDLAAYLVLREAEAMRPDIVVMNGIAGFRQPLWLELGAVNRADHSRDGSSLLQPVSEGAVLIPEAGGAEVARGNLAHWDSLRAAAEETIAELAEVEADRGRFDEILTGVRFAAFPRSSNTCLCNNTTFTVGWGLDHPDEPFHLFETSDDDEPLEVKLADLGEIPRWFMHWPSALQGEHVHAGRNLLAAILDAELGALADGELPKRGDSAWADP